MMMPKIPPTGSNNGAWMNRELFTIQSTSSSADFTNETEKVKNIGTLRRLPSDGESSVSFAGHIALKSDSFEVEEKPLDKRVSRVPSYGDLGMSPKGSLLGRVPSKSVDSIEFVDDWTSIGTDDTSDNSQDELFVLKKKLSERSTAASSGGVLQVKSQSSGSGEDQRRDIDPDSQSNSSKSQGTTYTSDASTLYQSMVESMNKTNVTGSVWSESPGGEVQANDEESQIDRESFFLPLTLQNVDCFSHFDQASNDNDLSTIDGPISPEFCNKVFLPPAILPLEIAGDAADDVSSLCGAGVVVDAFEPVQRKDTLTIVGYEESSQRKIRVAAGAVSETTSVRERILDAIHDFLDERSRMEILFIFLIAVSTITLVILVLLVFA